MDGEGLTSGDAFGDGLADGGRLGDDVAVGAGTGGAARFCALGAALTSQSGALSFVSMTLPPMPPGFRSILERAAGAGAAVPSTNPLVASPQPSASIGAPPTTRRASAPPVAARPPLYEASAVEA